MPDTANDLHGVLDGYRKFLREVIRLPHYAKSTEVVFLLQRPVYGPTPEIWRPPGLKPIHRERP